MSSRKNKGVQEGKYVGVVLENWNIYKTAKGYKVASLKAINGKANYHFAITGGSIDRAVNLDASKMQTEHPELYQAIEEFFQSTNAPVPNSANDDFGDLALSQGQVLSPVQQWKRSLLMMRMYELEWAAKKDAGIWDAGIRMSYSGIFKFKIDDATYKQAMNYVTKRDGSVDLQTLLTVLRDYYGGKYRPSSCATLEAQLNLIAGEGTNNADLL